MPTDFHYDPLTGPISGPDFIKQTESAFNELGANTDEAKADAAEAKEIGQAANVAANQAILDAAQAQSDADLAKSLAGNAQAAGDSGIEKADAAQAKANQAYDLAAQADSKAGEAQEAADSGIEKADAAKEKADAGYALASTAGSVADQAKTAVKIALGTFEAFTEAFDANDYFKQAYKYLVSDYSNMPSALNGEAFIEISVSSDNALATQSCWDQYAQHIFTRCASINWSAPADPVVEWTPWNSVAVPEMVKSVAVETDPDGQPSGTYLVITMETETGDVPVYINMTALVGQVYTAGNNAIAISGDYQISLKLSAASGGLSILNDGLAADLSGKQDKIAAGTSAGHVLLDTTTAGTVGKSDGVLTLTKNLTVGASSTYTGAVSIRSAGSSPTIITGPNNGTATLQAGTAQTTGNLVTSGNMAATAATASDSKYLSEKAVVTALNSISTAISRGSYTTSASMTASFTLTTGSYKVGSNNLILFYNNCLCSPGAAKQYTEIGTAGAASTTVSVLFDVPAGGVFDWIIIG